MGNEAQQNTPDLDRVMMEGHPVFDGTGAVEPADKSGQEGPAKTAEEEAAAAAAAAEIAAPAPEEEGKEKPAGAAPTEREAGEEPLEQPRRFKSHEEAERGYRELQGKTTRAEQRAAEAERELAAIWGAEERRKQREAADLSFTDFAAERREAAMAEIDELDLDAPDYKKKVAQAWARADRDIFNFRQEQPAGGAAETPAPTGTETPAAGTPPGAAAGVEEVRAYAKETIVKAGFDAEDPLFWIFASRAPAVKETGESIPLDEQIQWAIDQTKTYQARIMGDEQTRREAAAAEAGRAVQHRELTMGKGGGGPPAGGSSAEESPVSLDAAIRSAQRRL